MALPSPVSTYSAFSLVMAILGTVEMVRAFIPCVHAQDTYTLLIALVVLLWHYVTIFNSCLKI